MKLDSAVYDIFMNKVIPERVLCARILRFGLWQLNLIRSGGFIFIQEIIHRCMYFIAE